MALLAKIRAFIEANGLFHPGDRVGVAVSGGVDSICLLHALMALPDLALALTVCHLDHGLRPESARDADFVRDTAAGLRLPYVMTRIDVKAHGKAKHLSLEMAARELRYAELCRMADELRLDRVALGHHLDDQVETVLLRILRGTGLEGLSGMAPVRGERFVRPLLCACRDEILEYAKANGLSWIEDATNRGTEILRNRIRHNLLPALRTDYNQRIDRALLGLSTLAREALSHLELELASVWPRLAIRDVPGALTFSTAALAELPPTIGRLALRKLLALAGGDPGRLSQNATNRLWEFARSTSGRRLCVPGGFTLSRQGDRFALGRIVETPAVPEQPLPVPGRLVLANGRIMTADWWTGNLPNWVDVGGDEAYLDGDMPVQPLMVRGRRPGDRFRPLGLGGEKKVKESLIEAKVPRECRNSLPLVVDGLGRVVWLAGLRLDDRFRITAGTKRVLHLSYHRFEAGCVAPGRML